ncbi:MAG: FAD-dependent thymidylate synthase [Oscillospiraceae bacterium]
MKVTLITHTPNPEKTIACAAKLCYSSSAIDDLYDGLTEEKSANFVKMLSELGHASPIEHASFTFGIEGVSRSLLAQITRHRMASFSVQSQRYVKENSFEFVTPPEIKSDKNALLAYNEAMENSIKSYNKLCDILKENHVKKLIEEGFTQKQADQKAEKMAIEDARFVLPNASTTKMVVTMNARSLYNFFQLRCCNRAQWEIREVANEMLKICVKVAPTLFVNAGPACVNNACGEGKMNCGKMSQQILFFQQLKKDALKK